jgi:hypothetical protein
VVCATNVAAVNYASTVTGWSAAGTANFGSASIVYYSGYGTGILATGESATTSQHAVDNVAGTDAFLINFGANTAALNQLSIGWKGADADVSILRYTGTAAPTMSALSVANARTTPGWELVGDFANLSTTTPLNFNNSGTIKTASWWLVSAYNSAYAGGSIGTGLSNGDDYFKMTGYGANVTTPTNTNVPEPGTFALIGIALFGLTVARRKAQAK